MNEGLKMTFRERIADWISGGALSSARTAHDMALGIQKAAKHDGAVALDRLDLTTSKLTAARARLRRIAAEEKPTSNATVKRMARIARGEE